MATVLVSFANPAFASAQRWLSHSARQFGIAQQHLFTAQQFAQTDFFARHQHIAAEPFGAGLYLWKPYYILQVLQQLQEGDVLLYADSGHVFVQDPQPLIDLTAQQDIVLFENYQGYHFFGISGLPFTADNCYRNVNHIRYWCKADALLLQDAYHDETVLNSMMVDASIMLFRKSARSVAFVETWLQHCCDRRSISPDDNQLGQPNHPGFIMHIYDQSIISIMASQQRLPLYRCPSQYGNHYKPVAMRRPYEYQMLPGTEPLANSAYDTITRHHRYKDKGSWWRWKTFLYKEFMMLNTHVLRHRIGWVNRWLKLPPYKLFS